MSDIKGANTYSCCTVYNIFCPSRTQEKFTVGSMNSSFKNRIIIIIIIIILNSSFKNT